MATWKYHGNNYEGPDDRYTFNEEKRVWTRPGDTVEHPVRPGKVYRMGDTVEDERDLGKIFGKDTFELISGVPAETGELPPHAPADLNAGRVSQFPAGQVAEGHQVMVGSPKVGEVPRPSIMDEKTAPRRQAITDSEMTREDAQAEPEEDDKEAKRKSVLPKSLTARETSAAQRKADVESGRAEEDEEDDEEDDGAEYTKASLSGETVEELKARAKKDGAELHGATTKDDIVKAIQSHHRKSKARK